jgi:SAM-dependent methyltransferase
MQARWNARYQAQPDSPPAPQPWLQAHAARLPTPGLALEVAMGLGGSAAWLAARGWRVAGVDIAEVAVRRARAHCPALLAWVADLEQGALPARAFDLILDFYYLDRALWPQFRRALRPGGVLLLETFVRPPDGAASGAAPVNPAYVLAPGELRAAFADWEVLDYAEREQDGRWVAGLAARNPGA